MHQEKLLLEAESAAVAARAVGFTSSQDFPFLKLESFAFILQFPDMLAKHGL